MHVKRSIPLLLGAFVLTAPSATKATELTCTSRPTLEQLVACARDHMPRRNSGIFVTPTSVQMSDWRSVARSMLRGSCGFTLPGSLRWFMQLRLVRDAETRRNYCVLMEVLDANNDGYVDRGFGTFIVDPQARRELSHQAAHPIADNATESQAVTIFKETRSRSFLLAGAHRDALPAASSCQSSYMAADAAHNVNTMFHTTYLALADHYQTRPWWVIQWHGMAADTCEAVDVHLSHGMDVVPEEGDKIVELRDNLLDRYPGWRIGVPGSGMCTLNATANVQGRLLNGVPANRVCSTPATSYTGRFVHVEQDPAFRDPDLWISAVIDTWP